MDDIPCPQCSLPLQRVGAPAIFLQSDLVIYRCSRCIEMVPFWGETIESQKHFVLTASGELRDLPEGAPRQP
jgi:DNA-directed RNA polymerase subunit RPC12/RpoP